MDPLQHLSGVSLLPRTFRDSKKNVSNSCSNSTDLKFIHDSMRSKNLRSPNKLSEQANTIIDGVSKLPDTNFASLVTGENPNETRNGNPEDRRQALGRKRPRFSMKPQSSQPTALEPTLDIDKLEDPVEFFLAHEKLENARMELKRLQGSDLSILDEHSPIGAEERHRRPGLLGKKARYKHHTYGKADKLVVSQEAPQQEIMSSNHNSQGKVTPISETHERDTISKGSISQTERRVNSVLDELLYDKCESLDGNGTLSFLQEHLQLKPIDLDKLCLPDFPDFGKVDFKYVKEKLIKSPKVSSDMQNILKSISAQTPQKDKPVSQSPSSSIASPTPPKNPFASINLLKKSIVKSREMSHDTDASDSDKMESTMNVDLDDRSPAEIITIDSIDLSKKCSEMEDTNMLMTPNEMQENVGDMPQEALAQCQHDTNVAKDIGDKTPEKNKPISGNPDSTMALPTLPQNPFASIYFLKRSILKSKEKSHDASTSLDPFPAREFSGAEHFDQRIIDSDNMESTTNEHIEITVVGRSPPDITACDSIHLSNKCLEMEDTDHVRGAANDNVIPTTPNEMQENIGDVPQETLAQCLHDTDVTKSTPMINTSDQTEGQTKVQENVEDQSHGSILANIEFSAPGTSKRSKAFPQKKGKTRSKGQSSSAAVSLHATGEPSKSSVKVSGQEDKQQGPSLASRRNSKKPANDGCKSKRLSLRHSLAGQSSSAAVSLHATGEPSKSPVKVSGQEDKGPSLDSQRNSKKPANDGSKSKRLPLGHSLAAQSSFAAVSLHATGEPSKSPVKVSGQENKQQEPSLASQRNSKKPANDGHKRKRLSLRKSLADAGTSWISGVRRSNRIKMRPLEYWKGERLLYGRVHKSLTTVIGVKYMSPGKGDEKATMKVKSFKDEYSELVEFAALH